MYLVKILLIGNSGVGKSCMLLRFTDDEFTNSHISTIGIDFKIRTIEIDGVAIKIQVWDTAGQERFRTITTAYYRGVMGILIVYDVTNSKSFSAITNWIKNIAVYAADDVNKILVGNKCDLVKERAVSYEAGAILAEEHGMNFVETSAKNSVNVDEVFIKLVRDIKQKSIDPQIVKLENEPVVKKCKSCKN